MSDMGAEIEAGIRVTRESLEAEHAAATNLRHVQEGRAPHPAREAALQHQTASHVLGASLRGFLLEPANTVDPAVAIAMVRAAVDWWDTYDVELYLAAAMTVAKLRELLEKGGGTWREGMSVPEMRAECNKSLHKRRGR